LFGLGDGRPDHRRINHHANFLVKRTHI
jgi:hypothetical protein